MRYRSATVAGFHGLLCFVELIERTSGNVPTNHFGPVEGKSKANAHLAVTLPFFLFFSHKP